MPEPILTPTGTEWVSRCDICGKPFIYGHWVNESTLIKHDDIGEQRGRRWAHRRCFEAEAAARECPPDPGPADPDYGL